MTYTKVPSATSASPASPNNVPSSTTTVPGSANYTPVPLGNTPPVASAGPDASYEIINGTGYQLAGAATGTAPITYSWARVSGPAASFVDNTDPTTKVNFTTPGTSVLRLTATNAYGSSTDDITLTVTETSALDGLTSAPRAVYSMRRRLLTSYTGPLYRVRKTTGGDTVTEHDVPYVASTNLADSADLATFVGAQSWVVTKQYDQTSGARDISQATGANQPTGGATGTPVTLSSQPAADFDGSNDRLARADALGLSGATAISMWIDASFDTVAAEHVIANIGTNGAGTYFAVTSPTTTSLKIGINGANRIFTASLLTSGRHRILARIGAGAQVGTSKIQQNGSELAELSSTNPTNTMTLGTAATSLGNDVVPTAGVYHDGKLAEFAVWNADLSAGDLAILNGLS